jgi:type III secretory pathway lipoprotein EscJ
MAALVTILTVSYPHELVVIKGKLESEGIACYTQDELMAQIAPFYSNAIGGVKLQVPEDQVARALEILKEGGYDA